MDTHRLESRVCPNAEARFGRACKVSPGGKLPRQDKEWVLLHVERQNPIYQITE